MSTAAHRRPLLGLVALLLAVLPTGALAHTGPTADEIEDAKERVAELDAQLVGEERKLAQTERELASLDDELLAANEDLAAADAAAEDAQRVADLARAEAEQTRRELGAAREELAENDQRLADLARHTYKYGPQATAPVMAAFERLIATDDPNEMAYTLHMLEVILQDRALLVDESIRLIDRTEELIREARVTELRRRDEAEVVVAARDEAAARHADVMALVDRADASVRRQQQILAQLGRDRRTAGGEVEALVEAARRAAEATVTATPLREGLTSVGGITVAASLAPQLKGLLEAARADGLVLGGSGYRSPETTARLRRVNGCPDVHESPSSSCRVPTARPGESMHEQGLAVDFTYQGRTICYPQRPTRCQGNAAFDWLTANAGRYGLQVLSTEAWHWSTNGR